MKICNSCGKCCFDTEMQLSQDDIATIESSSIKLQKDEFSFLSEDGYQLLKNIDGHCIFLNPKSNICKIYDNRPFGCKCYPLVFDMGGKVCYIDDFCPHPSHFYQEKSEFKKTCKTLRKWVFQNFF